MDELNRFDRPVWENITNSRRKQLFKDGSDNLALDYI